MRPYLKIGLVTTFLTGLRTFAARTSHLSTEIKVSGFMFICLAIYSTCGRAIGELSILIVVSSISGLSSSFDIDGFYIISCIFEGSGTPLPLLYPIIIYWAIFIISGLFIISFTIGLFIISDILFIFIPFIPGIPGIPPMPYICCCQLYMLGYAGAFVSSLWRYDELNPRSSISSMTGSSSVPVPYDEAAVGYGYCY